MTPPTVSTTSDSKLAQARVEAGIPMRRVADAAGCSVAYLHDVEHGNRTIDPEVANVIAGVLEADPHDLFEPVPARWRAK